MKDKRCPICREVYTPISGHQKVCRRCVIYYYISGTNGKSRSFYQARQMYLADMRDKRIKVSDWPMAQGCEGCKYWRSLTGGASASACHYCLDEERLRPCLPGRNCTVRINRKKEKQTCEFSE